MKIAEGMEEKFDLQKTKTLGEFRAETGRKRQAVSDGAVRQFARTGSAPTRTESAQQEAIKRRKRKEAAAAQHEQQQTADRATHPVASGGNGGVADIRPGDTGAGVGRRDTAGGNRDAAEGSRNKTSSSGATHQPLDAAHSRTGDGGGGAPDKPNQKTFQQGDLDMMDLSKRENAKALMEAALEYVRQQYEAGKNLKLVDSGTDYGRADDFGAIKQYLLDGAGVTAFDTRAASGDILRFRVPRTPLPGVHEFGIAEFKDGFPAVGKQLLANRKAEAAAPDAALRECAYWKCSDALKNFGSKIEQGKTAGKILAQSLKEFNHANVGRNDDTAIFAGVTGHPADPLFYVVDHAGKKFTFLSSDFSGEVQARLLLVAGDDHAQLATGAKQRKTDPATFTHEQAAQRGHGSLGWGSPGQPRTGTTPIRPAHLPPDLAPPTLKGRMVATAEPGGAYLLRWNFSNGTNLRPAYRWSGADRQISLLNSPSEKSVRAMFDLAGEKNLHDGGALTITGSAEFQALAVMEAFRRGIEIGNEAELTEEARKILDDARTDKAIAEEDAKRAQNAVAGGFLAAAAARVPPPPKPEAGAPDAPDAADEEQRDEDEDERDADDAPRRAGRMR